MDKIRIVGICSSPRIANTDFLVHEALAVAHEKYDAQTEFISFKGKKVLGCIDCKACIERRETHIVEQCILEDDWSELVKPLVDPVPNGLIIGTPVYFANVNSQLRAFMERCTSLFKGYWYSTPHKPPDWSHTVAGALSVGFHRHGGQELANQNIVQWLLTNGFITVGSHSLTEGPVGYIGGAGWQGILGQRAKDAISDDKWGIRSARVLGEKVTMTALRIAGTINVNT